jgi:hypothetical protein
VQRPRCRVGLSAGRKGYPSDCSTARLPADVKTRFPNLYPSSSLYDHEWDKHGTCSGLTPEGYLSLSKQLIESVVIPARYKAPEQPVRVTTARLKNEFVAANPALSEASLAVYCSGSVRFLSELYVCFSQDGQPQVCSQEIHSQAAELRPAGFVGEEHSISASRVQARIDQVSPWSHVVDPAGWPIYIALFVTLGGHSSFEGVMIDTCNWAMQWHNRGVRQNMVLQVQNVILRSGSLACPQRL